MRIDWTEPALDDLEGIRDYIARDSPYYAARFIEQVLDPVENLADHPALGRRVPEAGAETIRELIVRSYRIIYRFPPTRVQVLTVLHGSRDLASGHPQPWEID